MGWFSDVAGTSVRIILNHWNKNGCYIGKFSKAFWESVQILAGEYFVEYFLLLFSFVMTKACCECHFSVLYKYS